MSRIKIPVMSFVLVCIGLLLQFPSHWHPQTFSGYIGNNIGAEWDASSTHLVPPETPPPEPPILVRGRVTDEAGVPIYVVGVELIPVNKTGNERWYATKREWTDRNGEYQFRGVESGEYVLAIQKQGAPDGERPFLGTFYPGVDEEARADRILVNETSAVELNTIRLQRVETVTLNVKVTFEDGTVPRWSNLLFHNLSFPNQAVIGDTAPGIENGVGEMTLPVGYEYYAQAAVNCDAGTQIKTLESRPVQKIRIEMGRHPDDLTFVIPGSACTLWKPRTVEGVKADTVFD